MLFRSKRLCDVGDSVAVARSMLLPTQFEKALIQGDLKSQMARDGKRKFEPFKKALEQVQYDKVQITDRVAIVPSSGMPKPLRFYWFSGDWFLSKDDY